MSIGIKRLTQRDVRAGRKVIAEVAKETGVMVEAIYGKRKTAGVSRARLLCYKRLRDLGLSYAIIGAMLGRDHTTVIRGIAVLEALEDEAPGETNAE